MREAQQNNDTARMQKFSQIIAVLQQASTPPEMEIVNELVDVAGDDAALEKALNTHANVLTEELTGMIVSLMQQVEQQGANDPNAMEIGKRLEKVYRAIVKRSMEKNIQ